MRNAAKATSGYRYLYLDSWRYRQPTEKAIHAPGCEGQAAYSPDFMKEYAFYQMTPRHKAVVSPLGKTRLQSTARRFLPFSTEKALEQPKLLVQILMPTAYY